MKVGWQILTNVESIQLWKVLTWEGFKPERGHNPCICIACSPCQINCWVIPNGFRRHVWVVSLRVFGSRGDRGLFTTGPIPQVFFWVCRGTYQTGFVFFQHLGYVYQANFIVDRVHRAIIDDFFTIDSDWFIEWTLVPNNRISRAITGPVMAISVCVPCQKEYSGA